MKPNITLKVPRRVAQKVMEVQDELAGLGVEVRTGGRKCRSAGDGSMWNAISHAWLLISIAKAAYGSWPKIRKILVTAGLTRHEITTLGLSKHTRITARKTSSFLK